VERITRLLGILALGLCVSACGDDEQPAQSDEPAAETNPEEARATTLRLMAEHYTKATEGRQAIIGDDIDAARVAMQWLADNETHQGGLPDELRPHLANMREKAGRFTSASTLTDAGVAFGLLLTHCGECHDAAGRGPTFEAPPVPQGDELPMRMQRHRWSAERMWEGLVTHNEGIFDAGAEVLETVILHPEELPQGVLDPDRVQAIADHVHELGEQAESADDWPARGEIYGRFLATCATCHRAMGVAAVARAAMDRPMPTTADTATMETETP
jgi:mono/diheme cytochrome c family protein